MRGNDKQQGAVFSYVNAEQRIASDHPLRRIRAMTDVALGELSAEFDRLYAAGGRRSIAPERLLRALLLQVLYSRRNEARECGDGSCCGIRMNRKPIRKRDCSGGARRQSRDQAIWGT